MRHLFSIFCFCMMMTVSCISNNHKCEHSAECKREVQLSGHFVHHVLFWLAEPENPKARVEFEGALRELVSIDLIVASNIGAPAATDREVIENSYTYSMLTTFANKADQDLYQTHPDHLKFIEKYGHLWIKVMVIDAESIDK